MKTIQRSNSFDIINHVPELEATAKVKRLQFESGINFILEISKSIFATGNLIGDIKIIEKYIYKEIQTIKEHNGTIIYSLINLNSNFYFFVYIIKFRTFI